MVWPPAAPDRLVPRARWSPRVTRTGLRARRAPFGPLPCIGPDGARPRVGLRVGLGVGPRVRTVRAVLADGDACPDQPVGDALDEGAPRGLEDVARHTDGLP